MATLSPEAISYQTAHINEDKGPTVYAVSVVLTVLSFIIVLLRFLTRYLLKLPLKWDDWLILPGMLVTILICVEMILSVQFGLGKHLIAADPMTGYKILQIGFFLSITYTLAHWFIKMSILFFYIRIFTLRMKWFKIGVYAMMAYVTGWALSLIVFVLAQCRPLNYFWQRFNISLTSPATGVCVDTASPAIWTSVLNTIADFAVLVLPLIVLSGLQLRMEKKIALIGVFLVGTFACAAGIARLVAITTVLRDSSDTTYTTADTYLWTIIEASVGLMCACFPIIGPIFKRLRDNPRSKNSSYYHIEKGTSLCSWQWVRRSGNTDRTLSNKDTPLKSEANSEVEAGLEMGQGHGNAYELQNDSRKAGFVQSRDERSTALDFTSQQS